MVLGEDILMSQIISYRELALVVKFYGLQIADHTLQS